MNGECDHNVMWVHPEYGAGEAKKEMLLFLKQELTVCPNCGGLVPELGIEFDKNTWTFVCYEKREMELQKTDPDGKPLTYPYMADTKVIQQTNYKKLLKYLQAKEKSKHGNRS